MDEQVIAAMARWPDVPAVYGWLSLTESGQWRLHPQGDALQQPETPGDSISSPQILAFINRNYASDDQGQWYFQNGPQRVYVRLDAAPYTAHTVMTSSGQLVLRTHTGLDIQALQALYLDDDGRLYAASEHGAALIAGRDLPALLDALQTDAGTADSDPHAALARCLETGETLRLRSDGIHGFPSTPLALHSVRQAELEATLQFRRLPSPPGHGDSPAPVPTGFR